MELSDKSVKMKGILTSDALFYFKRIANVIYGTSSSPSGLRISSNAGILASIKTNDKSGRWAEPEVLIGKLYKLFFFKLIGIETDVSFHSNCSFLSFFFHHSTNHFIVGLIAFCNSFMSIAGFVDSPSPFSFFLHHNVHNNKATTGTPNKEGSNRRPSRHRSTLPQLSEVEK